jgi:hypothetical protein
MAETTIPARITPVSRAPAAAKPPLGAVRRNAEGESGGTAQNA